MWTRRHLELLGLSGRGTIRSEVVRSHCRLNGRVLRSGSLVMSDQVCSVWLEKQMLIGNCLSRLVLLLRSREDWLRVASERLEHVRWGCSAWAWCIVEALWVLHRDILRLWWWELLLVQKVRVWWRWSELISSWILLLLLHLEDMLRLLDAIHVILLHGSRVIHIVLLLLLAVLQIAYVVKWSLLPTGTLHLWRWKSLSWLFNIIDKILFIWQVPLYDYILGFTTIARRTRT